jgi:hypothetical protein
MKSFSTLATALATASASVLAASWIAAAGTVLAAFPAGAEDEYNPKMIKCTMIFNLKGWSVGVASSKGEGTITCDNGEKAEVVLDSKAVGLTVGKSAIRGGRGVFSVVPKIEELYGGYGSAEAHAGAGASSKATVLTKGDVSLALSGQGQGMDLGVSIGSFVIKPK